MVRTECHDEPGCRATQREKKRRISQLVINLDFLVHDNVNLLDRNFNITEVAEKGLIDF